MSDSTKNVSIKYTKQIIAHELALVYLKSQAQNYDSPKCIAEKYLESYSEILETLKSKPKTK